MKGLLPAVAVQAESVDVYATTRGAAVAIDAFGWAHAMAMHKYESPAAVCWPPWELELSRGRMAYHELDQALRSAAPGDVS